MNPVTIRETAEEFVGGMVPADEKDEAVQVLVDLMKYWYREGVGEGQAEASYAADVYGDLG